MNNLVDFLSHTVEYVNLGWNAPTISFVGTIFLTIFQGWSLFKQSAAIWKNRSGEPIFTSLFVYSASYSGMLVVYGILQGRIANIFNGLLFIPYLVVVFSLYRFRNFSQTDKLASFIFPLLIPAMFIWESSYGRELFFFFGAALVVVPIIGQTRKLSRVGQVGSIEPSYVISLMTSNLFWAVYGISTGDWAMSILNPVSFVILVCFLTWYYTFKKLRVEKKGG
ncbi:MAG: hypothetical protein WC784_06710 [Candidatus Shapirobacteria bacterium]